MRKWVFIGGVAVALVAALAATFWPRVAPAARRGEVPGSVSPRSLPDFAAVQVTSGEGEGLALTGRVLDSAGKPVAGADVSLAASAERTLVDVRCDECGQALLACTAHESTLHTLEFFEQQRGFLTARATARSDAEGRFRFEHLVGVSFSVWARAPGLGVALRDRAAPGEPVDLFLPPLRAISGLVVDDAGRPVAGARVRAVSRKVPLPFEVSAGADGAFSLSGLGEGPFYVLATAAGFQPTAESQVEAGPQALRLVLAPSRTLEVRVTRKGQPAPARVRIRGDHLSREQRTEGPPLQFTGLYPDEVVVTAEAPGLGSAPRTVTLSERVTQVTLELEEAGRLLVTVVDEEGQPVPKPELFLRTVRNELLRRDRLETGALADLGPLAYGDYVVNVRAEGFKDNQVPARVAKGETSLEVEMSRATTISGQVLDEYGRPAANVSVLVNPTGDAVLADADGRFIAQVPMPGLYELHAHHSEWGGGKVKVTAPASGVELSLEPHAALEVTVSSGGRRVEGADVMMWVEQDGIFRSDRSSGSDGVVPMRGLPAATYWLVVSHPEYVPSDRQQVTVVEGQTAKLAVELDAGAPLRGDVVDEQGAPVAEAMLGLIPRGAEPAQSDARGHFEFRSLKADRAYRIEVHHPRYDMVDRPEGRPGGPPVRVTLRRRDVFRGRVVGSDGQPVRRFRVDENDVASEDGRFELPLPRAGDRVIAAVEAAGYEPTMVDLPAREDLGDVVLEKAQTVSGRVRDESGTAVADAVVTCDVCDESVLSGPDGRFTLTSPPYVSQFTVSARKGRLSGTQAAPRGGSAPIEVALRPATHLTGRVFLSNGQPAAGIQVDGMNADRSESVSLITGADGRYSADIEPGNYRFAVGDPSARESPEQPALVVQVAGSDMRLDLGPVPGSASLTLVLAPAHGKALWVVAGEVPGVGNPPLELLRSRWAQLIYQPLAERVVVQGLPPGRYTVVWGNFHTESPGKGPVVRVVEVPARGEVSLLE
ncbi:carboxypeptidase regulatory-like domain-containing protein [Myxococcaceae bacterium JPH2]|nr:carboxypeptidase regulatory-like domain-containing protein [Myxococcaceae bacterium JPH2]